MPESRNADAVLSVPDQADWLCFWIQATLESRSAGAALGSAGPG